MVRLYKGLGIVLVLLLLAGSAWAVAPRASRVRTSTTNFDGILSGTDQNVQTALDTIDDAITSSAPATASTSCTPNVIAFDSSYLYVCIASNTWERVAIASWAIVSEQVIFAGEDVIYAGEAVLYP